MLRSVDALADAPALAARADAAEAILRERANAAEAIDATPAARLLAALDNAKRMSGVRRAAALSHYLVEWFRRAPLADLAAFADGNADVAPLAGDLRDELGRLVALHGDDELVLEQGLRAWRARVQAGIVYRDLCGLNDLDATTAQLSDMAEAAIAATLAWATARETALRGAPDGGRSGTPQALVILAMGKLGARELNLSSDVDLIFAYPESGETRGGSSRAVTHQAFFIRVAQRLIGMLDKQTGDGFVFRVDMRLRPFGDSGALVTHFDGFEDYYQEHGRSWERYALIKARPITGDAAQAAGLVDRLRPFVYRRYLDFGAIEALREMKATIARERRAPQFADDVKLGPGGIREVEFVAQVFQLIFGGRVPDLRERRLRAVLPVLAREGWLAEEVVTALDAAYVFLRHTEHRIQALRDEQTQSLPSDELDRLRVAVGMGYADWPSFVAELDRHRAVVHTQFERLVARDQAPAQAAELWPTLGPNAAAQLHELGIGGEALPLLQHLAAARVRLRQQEEALQRLDTFVPRLLAAARATAAPTRAVRAGLRIAETVLRRSAYLALLNENPGAMARLVSLCIASDAITDRLVERPALLDELLDARQLELVPDRQQIDARLHAQLAAVPADDLEQQMDALRSFKESHTLRVAVCELTGALPLMRVSDSLTWCAEVILEAALDIARRLTTAQVGAPSHGEFLIVGYGKLGGLELGPGSDLDLLFLHDAAQDGVTNGGPRSVPTPTFYARLSQRLLHILTTQTHRGALYDIDTRLRPSGRAGMMVTTLVGFESYQREEAWTYEHQALVRARPVGGSRRLAEQFDDARRRILGVDRDSATLRSEVLAMRERMQSAATQLGRETSDDLKRGRGGIIDIEFIVQYLVLAHAARHPELMRWTDNVRILETAAAVGVLEPPRARGLTEAYLALRSAAHAQVLAARVPPAAELDRWRENVRDHWRWVFGETIAVSTSGS